MRSGHLFFDPVEVSYTNMGLNDFAHIASEMWTFTSGVSPEGGSYTPATLQIIGPTAYDFSNPEQNYHSDITSVVIVPEPASLSLLAIGAVGSIARRRRQA